GGSGSDEARAVAVGPGGNAFVAGFTSSSNLPGTSGGYQSSNSGFIDAFLSQVVGPPEASNDSYSLAHDSTLAVAAAGVLSNDTVPSGHTLTAVLVSGVSHGSLTLNSNGSFSYSPTTNYTGSDSFSYTASDGAL